MNRTFKFKAESLLRLRQRRQDRARSAMASAAAAVRAIQADIARLRDSLAGCDAAARLALQQRSSANAVLYASLSDGMRAAIEDQSSRLEQAQALLRRRRGELIEAMKQCKALKRLKERQRECHAAALGRIETKTFDDAYATHLLARGAAEPA